MTGQSGNRQDDLPDRRRQGTRGQAERWFYHYRVPVLFAIGALVIVAAVVDALAFNRETPTLVGAGVALLLAAAGLNHTRGRR